MFTYFFTYGSHPNYPFSGGWTEVAAPDMTAACALFRIFHPDRIDGLLNCASVYDEEHFIGSDMHLHGNFGRFCVEVIRCEHSLRDRISEVKQQ